LYAVSSCLYVLECAGHSDMASVEKDCVQTHTTLRVP